MHFTLIILKSGCKLKGFDQTEFVITRFHCMSIATDSIQKQYIGLDIDKFPLPSISVQFMATSPTGMLKY